MAERQPSVIRGPSPATHTHRKSSQLSSPHLGRAAGPEARRQGPAQARVGGWEEVGREGPAFGGRMPLFKIMPEWVLRTQRPGKGPHYLLCSERGVGEFWGHVTCGPWSGLGLRGGAPLVEMRLTLWVLDSAADHSDPHAPSLQTEDHMLGTCWVWWWGHRGTSVDGSPAPQGCGRRGWRGQKTHFLGVLCLSECFGPLPVSHCAQSPPRWFQRNEAQGVAVGQDCAPPHTLLSAPHTPCL